MGIWDSYKEKIKNQITIPQSKELLTEKQWAKKHYVKLNDTCGKRLWANCYCNVAALYLWDCEVRPMTADELESYLLTEREKRKKYRPKKYKKIYDYIVIDTETTGLSPSRNELLQVSIIDSNGNTLFDEYIKPTVKEWSEAMAVNGITPQMVEDKLPIRQYKDQLNNIINSTDTIVGYNTCFDLLFLEAVGIENLTATIIDVMQMFAPIFGEYDESYDDYKWQKLTTCADYYHYDWGNNNAHNSLSDCRATLYCYQQICNNS